MDIKYLLFLRQSLDLLLERLHLDLVRVRIVHVRAYAPCGHCRIEALLHRCTDALCASSFVSRSLVQQA